MYRQQPQVLICKLKEKIICGNNICNFAYLAKCEEITAQKKGRWGKERGIEGGEAGEGERGGGGKEQTY